MGKRTPLYTQHVQAQAKIFNFGGWDMPLHYGSQLEEHHQVRRQAGVFDVSHLTVIDLTGKRVREFLRILLTNDVERLREPGKALYSCMLNEQGGLIDDLIVYYQEEHLFRIVTNAATRDRDIAWIAKHARHFGVKIHERRDGVILAIQGPQACQQVVPLLPQALQTAATNLAPFFACWNDNYFISRTGYTGEDGFEIMLSLKQGMALWQDLLEAGVAPIGLGARDTLRLEAGLNLHGVDSNENYSPLETGLGWTIAWSPENRNFIGREAVQSQRENNKHLVRVGLVLLGKGVLRAQQTVNIAGYGEGRITSGSFSPTLGVSIALARLPAGQYKEVIVSVRNKQLLAHVVKTPFVRQGKVLIDLQQIKANQDIEDIEDE
jgi:aminomethyltransferase